MITPMKIGYTLSGAGHLALISWALFGGLFTSEPLDLEVTEVTTISEAEFQALFAPSESPDVASDIVTPNAPEVADALPDMAAAQDAPPDLAEPEVTAAAEPDQVPAVPEPAPEAEVSDAPPVLQPPSEDVAVLLPAPDTRPQPRPAPRVAPEPVAAPEPDVRIDDVVQDEVTSDPGADVAQEEQDATSPEESTTEIVTEAERAAPASSVRPQTRPQRVAAAEPQPEADTAPSDEAVSAALAEALGAGGTDTTPEPTGPPLTGGERDALRVSVQRCWNVGSLSSDALQTTVVVSVDMSEDSRPVNSSIQLIESSGGSGTAVSQAFEAARRAIIRCGSSGFDLPVEKYDRWRTIEMVFNPEGMRLR